MRRLLALTLLTFAAAVAPAPGETVTSFDVTRGELPEGIAFDRHGALYVSLAPLGEIRRRAADGTWTPFASIGPHGTGGLAMLGLAFDRHGTLYAAAPTDNPSWHGVVAIAENGAMRHVAGTEGMLFPNALAVAKGGDIYVTDSAAGTIWRIPRRGEAQLWLRHELLEGVAIPLGANGIAYRRGRLYVANTEKGHVVEIPIAGRDRPGPPRILHAFDSALDGITVDRAGNFYVMKVLDHQVARRDRRGTLTTVGDASDDLNIPASAAFGPDGMLYITNLAAPDLTPFPNPAIIRLEVGPPWG
jgi:sugar lactone lactonase YvrE